MIELKNINKNIKNRQILSDINFKIGEGECVALLGKNGAGKSTLINIILDYISASKGQVELSFGRGDIGFLPQITNFPDKLKVQEIIDFASKLGNTPLSKDEITNFTLFSDKQNKMFAKNLSGGQRRILDFALSIINTPKFLVLDEPTSGMDSLTRNHFWRTITSLKNNGVTVLFTTHYVEEVEYGADRVLLLEDGKLLIDDTPFHLKTGHQKKSLSSSNKFFDKNNIIFESIEKKHNIRIENKHISSVRTWIFPVQYTNEILRDLLNENIDLSEIELTNSSLFESIFSDFNISTKEDIK